MDLKDTEFETLLREEFESRDPRPLPESQRALRPRRNAIWLAAAAVVVFAAGLSIMLWPNRPAAVVENVDGGLYRVVQEKTAALRVGEPVAMGETLRSNGSGPTLVLADGSRVEMRSQSELALEPADDGVRIRLGKGGVIVNAAKQRAGHLYVQTKDVMVSVVGTVFFVNAEEEGSRVVVIEGEVRVQQGATTKNLLPGEQLVTNPRMESLQVKEEISWSRDAEAHAALLRQSPAPPLPAIPVGSGDGRALIRAAREGQLETVRLLLDRGADPNVTVSGEGSPLIAAAREGRTEVVRLLVDRGADPNIPVPGDGNPLIAAAGEGRTDVVTLLLDRGAKIEDVVPGDENALIAASGEGRLAVVRLLVGRGANVNASVWTGATGPQSPGEWRTPLSHARTEKRADVVEFLLSVGAKE